MTHDVPPDLIELKLDQRSPWSAAEPARRRQMMGVVARVIHHGDLDDVRGLAEVMGRRAFLETISAVRMQSVKVAALWDAVLKLEGVQCTPKCSRQTVASSWPP